jgi:ferritin-like protein
MKKPDDFDIYYYEILVFLLEDLDGNYIEDIFDDVQWMLQSEAYSRFYGDRLYNLEIKLYEELVARGDET